MQAGEKNELRIETGRVLKILAGSSDFILSDRKPLKDIKQEIDVI